MRKSTKSSNKIKVFCRFRPLINLELELESKVEHHLTFPSTTSVTIPKPGHPETFTFDQVFNPESIQLDIFNFIGAPIVEDVLNGYNGTIFAYGQTGSGKTYTMVGESIYDFHSQGLIPRCVYEIVDTIEDYPTEIVVTIKCSMLEIYKETLKDLLGEQDELKIKEDKLNGIYVHGLTSIYAGSADEILELISIGNSKRTVAATRMNSQSSRSHELFMLEVVEKLPNHTEKKGILNLIDLAGSEKVGTSRVSGEELEEAKKINLSLSALGNVIHSLIEKSEHIPYRDSKLTRLLQESLGGNYKTCLIVNCSPHFENIEETLSTLKFAERAKNIKNKVRANIKKSVEAYMKIIEDLKMKLEEAEEKNRKIVGKSSHVFHHAESLGVFKESIEKSPLISSEDISFGSIPAPESSTELLLEENLMLKERNTDLETELKIAKKSLEKERKKRLKAEIKAMNCYESYSKLKYIHTGEAEKIALLTDEISSLNEQIFMLEKYLEEETEKYSETLMKIKEMDTCSDWEFLTAYEDLQTFTNFPVYTEDPSVILDQLPTEINVDIPFIPENIEIEDNYSQALRIALEENSDISNEIKFYLLKKQIIHSGIYNSDLVKNYCEIFWKFSLLKEKFKLKNKTIQHLNCKVQMLENIVQYLQKTQATIEEIKDSLDIETQPNKGKGKIIKPFNSMSLEGNEFKRIFSMSEGAFRIAKQETFFFPPSMDINNKINELSSSLHLEKLFNSSLKEGYCILKEERDSYKNLLSSFEAESTKSYQKEKEAWRQYLASYKSTTEKELLRKQVEIKSLNEEISEWIHKYMDSKEKRNEKKLLEVSYHRYTQSLNRLSRIPDASFERSTSKPFIISLSKHTGDSPPNEDTN